MKKISLLFFLLPFIGFSQWSKSGEALAYQEVVEIDMKQSEIKSKMYEFVATTFNDANQVVKMNSEEKIILNAQFPVSFVFQGYNMSHDIAYNMITEFKDGRFRLQFQNIINKSSGAPVITLDMTFEDYEQSLREQSENMDARSRKIIEKQLKNDKQLRETYDQAMGLQNEISNKSKSYLSGLRDELVNYVDSGKSESDW